MSEKETIQISKSGLMTGAVVILAILLVVSIITGGFSGSATGNAAAPSPSAGNNQPNNLPPINMEALVDDDATKGDPNAPVTIVEFSDYECPFCERFYSQTESLIQTNYIDTGKVKFVYRDFPLNSIHPQAQKAAEAAECAGEQGMYWEMHEKLFTQGVSGGVASFKQYASDIGLDTANFNSCLDSGEMASEVAKDLKDGQSVGVTGTPGFIINGKLVSGAQPFSVFQQEIEAALNN